MIMWYHSGHTQAEIKSAFSQGMHGYVYSLILLFFERAVDERRVFPAKHNNNDINACC